MDLAHIAHVRSCKNFVCRRNELVQFGRQRAAFENRHNRVATLLDETYAMVVNVKRGAQAIVEVAARDDGDGLLP